MTDSNGVTWLCHRCGRKKDVELDTDPVLLRVCDGCQVENWTRPVKGRVIVAEAESVEEAVDTESFVEETPAEAEETTEIVKKALEAEPEPSDELDEQIAELMAKKEELAKRG